MLELARDRLAAAPGIRLVHGDARELPFEDASFEAITATHFFGHLPAAEAAAALAEARRLLAPGGQLFVVDHSWHPRVAAGLRSLGLARLLGGLQRLEVFKPA
jgi:demethylmenaquinone methyltransferase/2-methoxy-6-polyprenyl-1,4-benzoquinol methylase